MDMIQRIATKAIIINAEGKILVLREAATYGDGTQRGRYHAPGGRVEIGESIEDALMREVSEETGMKVTIGMPFRVGEWRPVIKGVPNQIFGIFFICKPESTDISLGTEHDHYEWVGASELENIDIMEAEDGIIKAYFDSLAD